jgi:nicotinamide phosphoribosyltransferase
MNYNNANFILMADSYKYSHAPQIPAGTEYTTAYFESRGSDDPDFTDTVNFGMQMMLMKYFLTPITMDDVEEAKAIIEAHGEPFNYEGWKIIATELGGKLPISIEAVAEGTVIPLRNVLYQVTNTDPRFPWMPAFVETIMVRDGGWFPTTVATLSYTIKKFMKATYDRTGSVQGLDFKLHDFGYRGVSSNESAEMGGIAHLVNFMGTDTVGALIAGRRYYNEPIAGFSIPAAEHSTITSWGEENEVEAYRNMLKQFGGKGKMLAVVSDSYDMMNAAGEIWGNELKQEVIDSGATVVVRPDSGDPTQVPIDVIEILMQKYGYTTNELGFRTLPGCIRVIQGDGITKDSIKIILANLEANKMTLDNLAFGMGGGLLQQVNRDTLKFAQKANSNTVNGVKKDLYKRPKTDDGKASKAGEQALIIEDGQYKTIRKDELNGRENQLREVYRNGELLIKDDFATIRARAA